LCALTQSDVVLYELCEFGLETGRVGGHETRPDIYEQAKVALAKG
jgi:hypothetical protein